MDGQSKTGKLRSPAIGTCRVQRKDDGIYVIDGNGAFEHINADRVTYERPPDNPKALHEDTTEQHDNAKNTEGPTYVVDGEY